MTAQLHCRFMRVGNALYPDDHLLIELYILSHAMLITAAHICPVPPGYLHI